MITFEKAQVLITQSVSRPKKEKLPLLAALGGVAAEKVKSPFPMPLFDNSAMDGFVFRANDTEEATDEKPTRLSISGVVKAGDHSELTLGKNQTYRMMTGASIPKATQSVRESSI